jgi:hypothetical protein
MVSMLCKNRPEFKVAPVSDKPEDKNKAKVSSSLVDSKYEMDNEFIQHVRAMKIATLLGTVYRKDWWDDNAGLAIKGTPLGDNKVSILSPFSIIPDYANAITHLDDSNYIIETRVMPVEALKTMFNKSEKGYFPENAKELVPEKNITSRVDIEESLKGNSPISSDKESPESDSLVLLEIYVRPTLKYPKGLTIYIANSKVLFLKETRYTNEDRTNWHPYTMWRYHTDGFKHYGIGLGEVCVKDNKKLNALDSLITLQRQTMASPKMLIPVGSVTPEQYPTGQPGEIIPVKPINGMIPSILPASPLDPAVYRERDVLLRDNQLYTAINDIMNGNQPSGVNTATAMQMLLEQTNNNHTTILKSLAKFLEEGQTKKLNLIKKFYIVPNSSFINRVKSMCKDTLTVEIDDFFTGKYLGDNVDVRIEGDSMLPKSSVVMQKTITDMIGFQAYGDISPNNPISHYKIMKALDAPILDSVSGYDIKRAEWENSAIRQNKLNEVVVLPTDNPAIHFTIVKQVIDDPEFQLQYNEQQQDNFWTHLLQHFVDLSEEQMKQLNLNESQIFSLQQKCKQMGIESDYATFQKQQNEEMLLQQKLMQEQQGLDAEMMKMQQDAVPAGLQASEAIAPDQVAGMVGGDVNLPVNSPSGQA